jgi:hypothetical protein
VDEVGPCEARRQPRREGRRRRPLQAADPAAEAVGLDAVLARDADARGGGVADQQPRLDPVLSQRVAEPEGGQLRAAGLELGEYARDPDVPLLPQAGASGRRALRIAGSSATVARR